MPKRNCKSILKTDKFYNNQMQEWVEKYPTARKGGSQKGDEYHKIVSNMFGCNGDPYKNTKKIMKNIAKHTSIKDAKDINK